MHITKNFSFSEFTKSATADKHGIDNSLPMHLYSNVRALVERLQLIRDALNAPLTISSGYRCAALNKAVGGASGSHHQLGLASYSFGYLGKLSRPTGEMTTELDVETQEVYEVPVYEELDDYHANLLVCTCCMQDTIDAVADVTIECPDNPTEVFA